MNTRTQSTRWSRARLIVVLVACGLGLAAALVLRSTASQPTSAETLSSANAPATEHPARGATSRSQAPTLVKASESHVDPLAARNVALEYDKGQDNAFFDGNAFLATAMANGTLSVKALKDQLLHTQELKTLPADTHFVSAKPGVVLERMAMIDTLEALAENDPAAVDALVEIGLDPIDSSLAPHVKRTVAAEKYDVFTALARTNWDLTRETFLGLQNQALKGILKPALIGGLVDTGLSRAQAVSKVEQL